MADTKQYIEQNQENGTIMISEDVIATIVSQAISEVDGVIGLTAKPVADIAEIIGKKNWGKGTLQYSGLENSMDCIVHEVAKNWI